MLIHDSNCELEDFETYLANLYEDMDAKVCQTYLSYSSGEKKNGKSIIRRKASVSLPT